MIDAARTCQTLRLRERESEWLADVSMRAA
jgi:hypothetical protein